MTATPQPGLFRERALQRLSSSEQLDRVLEVAPARRWVGAGALLAVVAAGVLWAAVAVVPTTLAGPGFLLPQGGLAAVQAPATGTVTSLALATGRHVVAGQRLGTMRAGGRAVPLDAPRTGVVSETDVQRGQVVATGDRLGLIEPVGWPIVVYAYVSTEVAAGLVPGTEAHVRFGAGLAQAFGYASGRVQSVSQFAATENRLAFILRDSALVQRVRALGATNEVVVALDRTGSTPSTLVWAHGAGPKTVPPAGLPATVTFVVGSHHPIDDVL